MPHPYDPWMHHGAGHDHWYRRQSCPVGQRPAYVHYGDTMSTLAARHHVSAGALQSANPQLRPSAPVPGQRLCVPVE